MKPAQSVFLNVPFDSQYERFFIALIAAVVSVGRRPRTVLELPEHGMGRLQRILQHLESCEISIHDLSCVGTPARFNMPFELGLACAIAQLKPPHAYILLERHKFRLDKTLSDLRGRDPYVYQGRIKQLIGAILDALRRAHGPNPKHKDVFALYRNLRVVAADIQRNNGGMSTFTRTSFEGIVAAAIELAAGSGMIPREESEAA